MKLKDPDTFRGRILPIYGDNGSGKTSLIKVLESELRENKEYKFVFFNVSNYRDETALIKAFFNTLFSNISQYGFFKNINDFENFLTKCFTIFDGKSVLFDFLKNLLTFSYNDSSLNSDKRDCVSEVVEDLNLKIIFVVDNIDRTSIKQRYLLIRMMHSISDIRGIVFLLPTSVSDLLNIGKPKLVSVVE
jgi:predicted KAP-like P-loop ATPase